VTRLVGVQDDSDDPVAAEVIATMKARGRDVLNIHRLALLSPHLAKTVAANVVAGRNGTLLSRRHSELAILRVSQILGSQYVWSQHVPLGRAEGLRNEQIDNIAAWRQSGEFDDIERAVLCFVDQAVPAGQVDDETFAAIVKRLSPREIVELTSIVGIYVSASIFTNTLQIDVDQGLIAKLAYVG
jgi:4-carboxymuconolactone decarboxylase